MREEFKPQQLPAFPVKMTGPCMFAGVELPVGVEIEWAGMTLRDYFAAKVMPSLLVLCNTNASAALEAYKIADAMLEARQK